MHEDDRKNEVEGSGVLGAMSAFDKTCGGLGTANSARSMAETEHALMAGEGAGASYDSASQMPLRHRLQMRLKEAHYQCDEATQRIRQLNDLLAELTPEIEQAVGHLAFVDRLRAVGIHV